MSEEYPLEKAKEDLGMDFKSLITEMERRYSGEEEDAFHTVISEAVATLDKRREKLLQLISMYEAEGNDPNLLEIDLKVIEGQHNAFLLTLTIYQDLKKLNRVERLN